jgi:hypothetical protein
MKLNRLGFKKANVDQNDILHKKEMGSIFGGYPYCSGTQDGVYVGGYCAGENISNCVDWCNKTYANCKCV